MPWSMWTTRSPGVSRSRMSRGTTRRIAFGPADADVAEQLAVGDEHQPVRAAHEPAVEAAVDEGDRARRRRLRDPFVTTRPDGRASLEELGEPRRLVADARTIARRRLAEPALHGVRDPRAAARREHRLAPAEQVARGQALRRAAIAVASAASDSQVSSSVRAPSSRRFQSRGGRSVGGQSRGSSPAATRSARRSSAWRHRKSAASPRSPGSSRTRSVSAPRWSSAVDGASDRRPDLGRVADGRGARLGRRWSCRALGVRRRPRTARGRARAAPGSFMPTCRAASGARPRRRGAGGTPTPGAGSTSRRPCRRSAGRSGRRRAGESISSPKHSIRIGQLGRGREHIDDAAPARELAAAGHLEHRRVAEVEQLARGARDCLIRVPSLELSGAAGRSSGASVCWISAWTLATRIRAGRRATPRARRPGPRSRRRRARSARRPARSAAPARRPRRVAQPGRELLGDAIADLRVARDPADPLAAAAWASAAAR